MIPEQQTVVEGGAAIITCKADGPIKWVHNGHIVHSEFMLALLQDSILIANVVSNLTTGDYVCYTTAGSTYTTVGVSKLDSSGDKFEVENDIRI